jgi:hypothetical protein
MPQNREGRICARRLAANIHVFESNPRLARIKIEVQGQKFRRKCAKIDLAIDNRIGGVLQPTKRALPAVIFRLADSPKG